MNINSHNPSESIQDPSNPLVMPELGRLLGAPMALQANTMWIATAGVLYFLLVLWTWSFGLPKDTHIYVAGGISVPVGLLLGYRAKKIKLKLDLRGAQPLRMGLGVAWRIGVLWVVVSAIGEYVAEETTTSTMANFPTIVGLSILTVTGSFLVAYGVTAAVVAIRSRSDGFRWGQAINLLIGIAGLAVGSLQLAADHGKLDGVDRDPNTSVGLSVGTTGDPPSSGDACTSGEITANVETRCVLKESDNQLPDGTHYQTFRYRGAGGENVTISMCAEFDTYLILGIEDDATDNFEWLAENDDGGIGMGTNAQLRYSFTRNAVYTVVANSLAPAETGEFVLTIEREGSTNEQFGCPPSG